MLVHRTLYAECVIRRNCVLLRINWSNISDFSEIFHFEFQFYLIQSVCLSILVILLIKIAAFFFAWKQFSESMCQKQINNYCIISLFRYFASPKKLNWIFDLQIKENERKLRERARRAEKAKKINGHKVKCVFMAEPKFRHQFILYGNFY